MVCYVPQGYALSRRREASTLRFLNGALHSSEVEELRVARATIRGFAARGEVVRENSEKLSSFATQVFALAPSFAMNTSGGPNALIVAASSQPVMGSAQEPAQRPWWCRMFRVYNYFL